jgi:hypothetical protein
LVSRDGRDEAPTGFEARGDSRDCSIVTLDMLDHIEGTDQVELALRNPVQFRKRSAEHRFPEALFGDGPGFRIDFERANRTELREHRKIVTCAASNLQDFGSGCWQGAPADQGRYDFAPGTVPPMALIELGHSVIDDAVHQAKTH